MFALIAQITQNTKIKTHGHEILIIAGIINPVIPVTQTPLATGTATGKTKSAQHVDFVATHSTTVKRKEKENFTAKGVIDAHIVTLHVQGNATQARPGSNTKAIIHPGQTTTQYHQQSQATTTTITTTTTTTTTQDRHQHPPVLGALQTSHSSS